MPISGSLTCRCMKVVKILLDSTFKEYASEEFQYDYFSDPEFSADISTHTHIGWEFLYIKSGDLTYTVDGTLFRVTPNSLIMSHPGAVHSLHPIGTIHYERHYLMISEQLLSKTILAKIPEGVHVLDMSENHVIPGIFERFHLYLSNFRGAELEVLLQGLINELWANFYLCTQTSSNALVAHSNAVLTKAIAYIKEHIEEPVTVQQICKALFISSSYLYYCFAKYMDVTPKQYIMLQKLQMVQQALANNVNPTSACRQYGFGTYSTFYRNYQKIYGCRPSDNPPKTRKIEL